MCFFSQGFEARGTPIKGRELALNNLADSNSPLTSQPPFTVSPDVLSHPAVISLYRAFAETVTSLADISLGDESPKEHEVAIGNGTTMASADDTGGTPEGSPQNDQPVTSQEVTFRSTLCGGEFVYLSELCLLLQCTLYLYVLSAL